MSADWRQLSRHAGLRLNGLTIEVSFGDQRTQRVFVDDRSAESIRAWSVVAHPSALRALETPLVDAWRRNRLSEFLGFTLDTRGRMVGEAWIPTVGLTADEWGFHIRNLARSCDRFEYLLTGSDER